MSSVMNPLTGLPDKVLGGCVNKANAATVVQTTVSTTAIKINFPEVADAVNIYHITEGATLWVGDNSNIAAGGSDTAPVQQNDILQAYLQDGNDNQLYAIVASGSVTVYTIGATVL